jgi:hypothetical protein
MIPGKTLDAAILEATPGFTEMIASEAENQIQLAGKKAHRVTWDDVRKNFLDDIDDAVKPGAAANKDKEDADLWPLEMDSLQLLSKARANESVRFARVGDLFTLVVPLSRRDSHEAVATWKALRETVAGRLEANQTVKQGFPPN